LRAGGHRSRHLPIHRTGCGWSSDGCRCVSAAGVAG
jgi:hypothetical protein